MMLDVMVMLRYSCSLLLLSEQDDRIAIGVDLVISLNKQLSTQ